MLKIVHISTNCSGGAGRAAYRIHEALLKNKVDSSFLNIAVAGHKDLKNVFLETVRPDGIIKSPGFMVRQKNRVRFRFKKHLGIELKSERDRTKDRRKKIIEHFERISSMLTCEIATLPFSSFHILENPLVKEADIIHLHWVAGMLDYPSFFANNQKAVAWTMHDMNAFQGLFHYKDDEVRNNEIVKTYDAEIRKIKRNAIEKRHSELVVVTPSQWLLKETDKSKTFKKVKSVCIPYPIDTDIFFRDKDTDFKKRHNIPDENSIFLFVALSSKVDRKGMDLLVEALTKIKNTPFTLVVLGDSNSLQKEGLDIRMAGNVTDNNTLRKYYSSVDALIISSREDNLPNVMLESLACGAPVIGFPVGGIKEHIIDFRTGLLANEVNSESLARAIEKFCKNQERFNSNEIRKYAEQKFSKKLIADQYIKLYSQLLKKRELH